MNSFVEENKIPGAALAVSRKGRLVYARGFGYADVAKKEKVQPGSKFRIASVSKPFTAVAVLQLVEKGKLNLDDKVLTHIDLAPVTRSDPRWKQITVRHCLQHTGGWDRDKSFDPIGRPWEIAKALDIRPPVTPRHIIKYMMGRPLDFDPGERYAYSNLGYLVLGRIIEAVTGLKYEVYLEQEVLAPLRIKKMRLGRALIENRAEDEVRYYDSRKRTGSCLFPPRLGQQVPLPYGAYNLEGFEAHGGWIASTADLLRLACAFDDPSKCPILSAEMIEEMWSRPSWAVGKAWFYGCGWNVRPIGETEKSSTWHNGYMVGTESLLVRRWDGLNWAVLFNTNDTLDGQSLIGRIDARVHAAADAVTAWPDVDMFDWSWL